MKIRNFLGVVIVTITLVPVLSVSALLMKQQSNIMQSSMQQELNRVLLGMTNDIEFRLSSLSLDLLQLSKEELFQPITGSQTQQLELQQKLDDLVKKRPLLSSLYFVELEQGRIYGTNEVGYSQLLSALSQYSIQLTRPSVQSITATEPLSPFRLDQSGKSSSNTLLVFSFPLIRGEAKQDVYGCLVAIIPASNLYQLIEPGLAQGESLKILDGKGDVMVMTGRQGQGMETPFDEVSLSKRAVWSGGALNQPFNYSISLWANQKFRMQPLEELYRTLSITVTLAIALSLFVAAWFARGIRRHFQLLSESIARFSLGDYKLSGELPPYEEFEEVQQLFVSMGETIHKQVESLKSQNNQLEEVAKLRDKYLNEAQLLNEHLELQVEMQTKEIRGVLGREESLRALLQGLLDLSVQLQLHDDLLAVVKSCLAKLSLLLGEVPVGVYINGCMEKEHYFESHQLLPEHGDKLKSSLCHYDTRVISALPKSIDIYGQPYTVFGLASRSGRMLGALVLQTEKMDGESTAVFKLFAKQVSAVIETVQLTSELEMLIRTDELTNFPNRKAFNESLKHAELLQQRYPERHIGVFVIDANGLKRVNDKYGHDAGDQLICMLGSILFRTCRQSDQVFRLSGDEFAILVEEGGKDSCATLMQRLLAEQGHHHLSWLTREQKEVAIPLDFSAGFATTELHKVEELFKVADQYMYQQKNEYYRVNPNTRSLKLAQE